MNWLKRVMASLLAKIPPDIVYPQGCMVRGRIEQRNGEDYFVVLECLTPIAGTNLLDQDLGDGRTEVHEYPYPPGTILRLEDVEIWGEGQ